MMRGWQILAWWLPLFGGACLFTACSSDQPASTSGPSGPSGSGAGGQGGVGGVAEPLPCGIDCATIVTDDCHRGRCDEESGTCFVANADPGTPCDDGLFCTVSDSCFEGLCVGGPENTCGMVGPICTAVVCDEDKQSCSTTLAPDDTPCFSSDPCTVNSRCKNGLCIGAPKNCFFAPNVPVCNEAVCNPETGACDPVPAFEGEACVDPEDPCTPGKTCEAGACVGGVPEEC